MKILKESKVAKRLFLMAFAVVVVALSLALSGKKAMAAEDDVVYIPDANFKALLNEKLGVDDPTADITEGQMASIKYLTIEVEDEIADITGIAYCTNLTSLRLDSFLTSAPDIELDSLYVENLSKLSNIESLTLLGVKSEDYSFISNYKYLEEIDIYNSDITALPNMSKCLNLTYVEITNCESLTDISALSGLNNISYIDFSDCDNISGISALKGMDALTYLNLEKVGITEDNEEDYMETIASLVNLERLYLDYCDITDKHTSMFDNLTKLKTLTLGCNDIYDIEFLLKHKDTLSVVQLYSNELTNDDMKVIEQMTELVILGVSSNNITDYSFISKLPKLGNGSIRFADWDEDFPSRSFVYISLFNLLDSTTYVIKNDVKDANGNYVAPLESELYTYNEKTQEITILTDKLDSWGDGYIYYEFVTTGVDGDEFHIKHTKRIENVEVPQIKDVRTFVGSTATISLEFYTYDDIEYQWYKDGNIIEGETSSSIVIENAQSSDAGKYTVVCKNKYSTYTSNEATLTVKTYKELSGNLVITGIADNMTAYEGDEITFTVTAEGGYGDYKYDYYYDYGNGIYIKSNCTNNVQKMAYNKKGEIKLYAYVYDSDGNKAITNTVTITVLDYYKLEVDLQIDGISESLAGTVGDAITLNASATGGSGDYTYKYVVEKVATGEIVTLKDYSTATSYSGKFTLAGTKRFVVYVKDSLGRVVESNSVTVEVYNPLLSKLAVGSYTSEMTIYEGKYITFTATATEGSGDYTYSFIVYNNDTGKWYRLADNISSNKYKWEATSSGNRTFYVDIKDSLTGDVVRSNALIVKALPKLKASLTLSGVSDTLPTYVGDKITYTVTASDGSGVYQYNFFIEVDGVRDYTGRLKDNVYNKVLSSPGETKLYAYAIDSAGNSAITSITTINVYDKLSVTGSISSSETTLGNKVTIISNTQGGVETKTYSYKVYNKDTKKWYTLAENVTDPVYVWTPEIYGNCTVYIYATDSIGTTVRSQGLSLKVVREPGLYKASDGNWYYLTKEEIDTSMTGLVKNKHGWWYVKEGKLDFTYTGMVKNSKGWWYVTNGKLDLTYTGMAKNKYGWWYMKEGKLDLTYTGMAENKHGMWYMNKGKLDTSVTGLVKTNIGWIYLTKGKLDTSVTGLVKNKNGWWYVKEGKLDWSYTGLATNKYGTWYVTKGKLDTSVNGMIKADSTWVYMTNGKLDTSYTGMAKNKYGWFYIKNGRYDATYTGLSTNPYGMWYMKNGALDLTYTGKAVYKGVTYNVVNGKAVK